MPLKSGFFFLVAYACFLFSAPALAGISKPKNDKIDCDEVFQELLSGVKGDNNGPAKPSGARSGVGEPKSPAVFLTSEQRQPILRSLNAILSAEGKHFPSLDSVATVRIPGLEGSVFFFPAKIPDRLKSLKSEEIERKAKVPHFENTLAWLEKSISDDLESAELLLKHGKLGTACYHAQSASG